MPKIIIPQNELDFKEVIFEVAKTLALVPEQRAWATTKKKAIKKCIYDRDCNPKK